MEAKVPKRTKRKLVMTEAGPSSHSYDLKNAHGLADSGARETTVTGALREPTTIEHGRWDLIPPECVGAVLAVEVENVPDNDLIADAELYLGLESNQDALARAAAYHVRAMGGLRPLAIHYARGAAKYADRNWEKGLETGRTVSSLLNHLDKLKHGLIDEDHRAAVVWNLFALMFAIPRLRDGRYPRELDTYGFLARAGA